MREGARGTHQDFTAAFLGFGNVAYAVPTNADHSSLSGHKINSCLGCPEAMSYSPA